MQSAIEMLEGGRGHATGITVLRDGRILGGIATSLTLGLTPAKIANGGASLSLASTPTRRACNCCLVVERWPAASPGTHSNGAAVVDGTALVGKRSVWFVAILVFKAPL
jgi:hypothetical protein